MDVDYTWMNVIYEFLWCFINEALDFDPETWKGVDVDLWFGSLWFSYDSPLNCGIQLKRVEIGATAHLQYWKFNLHNKCKAYFYFFLNVLKRVDLKISNSESIENYELNLKL